MLSVIHLNVVAPCQEVEKIHLPTISSVVEVRRKSVLELGLERNPELPLVHAHLHLKQKCLIWMNFCPSLHM